MHRKSALFFATGAGAEVARGRSRRNRARGWRHALLAAGLALTLAVPPAAQARAAKAAVRPAQPLAHAIQPKRHAAKRTHPAARPATRPQRPRPVRSVASAHGQVGLASHYGPRFIGRRMADGTRLVSGSDSAASKTLPLGTVARVRNLQNGREAVVTIRDRGPHVKGRIIDVSPGVARKLGMGGRGVVRVQVVPLRKPAARPAASRRK